MTGEVKKVPHGMEGQQVAGHILDPESYSIAEIQNSQTGQHAAMLVAHCGPHSVQLILTEQDIVNLMQVFGEVLPELAKKNARGAVQ